MNRNWPGPGRSEIATGGSQAGCFHLAFSRHGAGTHIGRQFVSYPMHMTRPFALDADIPSLLTVYQQSSSGGLYRADTLSSRFELGPQTAAHITTQAATVVHDCRKIPARQSIEATLEEGAFLALTPDPMVLFPGAACESTISVRMAGDAVLLLADAFARHDPQESARPFDCLRSDLKIEDPDGRLLVRDRFDIEGAALDGPASPLGQWRVYASFILAGDPQRLPPRQWLEQKLSAENAITGITALPNNAGYGLRCLAANAVAARAVSDALFALVVEAAFGHRPKPRRK